MKCEHCSLEAKYVYEDENLCEECLFDALIENGEIQSSTETNWYIGGEYIGDTCNGLTLDFEDILDYFHEIKEVETNE